MKTLNASNLSLQDVEKLLKLQELENGHFAPLLTLEPITEIEKQRLQKIKNRFRYYLGLGKASEGQVKLVTISPLLELAGFLDPPIAIKVEEGIARIYLQDKNTTISGRFDILAINRDQGETEKIDFWVLAIETKESLASALAGLPQLLTYAYNSLKYQEAVWGLTTNGESYRFVYIQQGNPPSYQLMPVLSLLDEEHLMQLLQVLKAIRKRNL